MNTDQHPITTDDAMQCLRRDYWNDVRGAAGELIQEARDQWENGQGATGENLREWLLERVREYVDGHSRIIYTRDAILTLLFSDNDGYSVENFGADGIVDDGGVSWSRLAFGAFYADVLEQLDAELEGGINDADDWFSEEDTTEGDDE